MRLASVVPVESASFVDTREHYKTTRCTFALWWVGLFLLHIVNIAYYAGVAMLYVGIYDTTLMFQLDAYSIGIEYMQWSKIAALHAVVAAVHAFCALIMVMASLHARRLAFQLPPSLSPDRVIITWIERRLQGPSACLLQRQFSVQVLQTNSQEILRSASALALRAQHSIFSRTGLLGVDNAYFDHVHVAREILETALQTIQAYRMTMLLPRPWLVRTYVGLLVANCWSIPILHLWCRNKVAKRRMACLICDAVLDMVASIGIALWIFSTYVPQYNDPMYGFPFTNWFDDVWFTNMQQEFQMMLIASWTDMCSRLIFALGLLQCMDAMKDLLTPPIQRRASATVPHNQPRHAAGKTESSEANIRTHLSPRNEQTSPRLQATQFFVHTIAPLLFVVWGLSVLVIHLVAEIGVSSVLIIPCELRLHPWFVSKPACSLVTLDCNTLGFSYLLSAAWTVFDYDTTARLVIRHCQYLQIPPTLREYKWITTMKFYNSSIIDWPERASLHSSAHHKVRAIFILRTSFQLGALPPGLLSSSFPPRLTNIVVSLTNLNTLPDMLHLIWPQAMTLAFERSLFSSIPPQVLKLNPGLLSFAGSPITSVPPELFESPTLRCLLLSFTKIQEIPHAVSRPSRVFYLLYLQGTNVSTFWSWMNTFIELSLSFHRQFFNAYGTPYCAQLLSTSRTDLSTRSPLDGQYASIMDLSTTSSLAFAQEAVTCTPGIPFYFPLELEDAKYGIA